MVYRSSLCNSDIIRQNFENEAFTQRSILFEYVLCQKECLTKKLIALKLSESAYYLKGRIRHHSAEKGLVSLKAVLSYGFFRMN